MDFVTLSDIADIKVGYQSRSGIKEDDDGEYQLIQAKDLSDDQHLVSNSLMYFNPERNPELYTVHKNDILFLARGVVNGAVFIDTQLDKTLASGSLYIIRTKTDMLLPQYIAWWLNTKKSRDYLQSRASGTTISFISKSVLSEVKMHIPSLVQQKKVIAVVELWKREQHLQKKLQTAKSKLIGALCHKIIEGEEK